jgi:lipoprotein-anchoring transpeptidase ErfK/SrfK
MMALAASLLVVAIVGQVAPRATAPPDALALQVSLDRAGFSCGAIDGRMGRNTARALEAYQRQHGQEPPLVEHALMVYVITPEDVEGPYVASVPADLMAQAKLPALTYASIAEALAERFHTTPAFLARINPGSAFAAGDRISVPNVDPFIVPAPRLAPASGATATSGGNGAPKPRAERSVPLSKADVVVTVSAAMSALTVTDASGRTIMMAPVTTGSTADPLPIGEWKINGVQFSPAFRYNPDLFWDADPAHTKATIPPGPNNPVGVVWIDLSKEHYGFHGTPEPERIGRVESHGCIRLTNWDAVKLAGLVKPGTRVVFQP